MPLQIPVGPYQIRETPDGRSIPYYIIPFDKNGECEAALTRQHLLDHATAHSDIFFFSHGWNNDWEAATERYSGFIDGMIAQRAASGQPVPMDDRPLLVGVFWPSQALAWFESETGPGFAGEAETSSTEQAFADELADALPAERRARFRELMGSAALSATESQELAVMLAVTARPGDIDGLAREPLTAEDLIAAATALLPPPPDFDDIGSAIPSTPHSPNNAGAPKAAGIGDWAKKLDPRQLTKPLTVWRMKDRAGVVGSNGVRDLLKDLLHGTQARIHLLGHSFGCKVMMSATAALPEPLPRKVYSALLLQPAVSQYAFAPHVPENGGPGGFYRNLERIERPVVATFSARDIALSKSFHLALRRDRDLGEQPKAAGEPPSLYCALGGYGPQASNETIVYIKDAGEAYDFGAGGRIVGIRGTRTIHGHGDISNSSTWWLASSVASGP
jgi:hypothetical protein